MTSFFAGTSFTVSTGLEVDGRALRTRDSTSSFFTVTTSLSFEAVRLDGPGVATGVGTAFSFPFSFPLIGAEATRFADE